MKIETKSSSPTPAELARVMRHAEQMRSEFVLRSLRSAFSKLARLVNRDRAAADATA